MLKEVTEEEGEPTVILETMEDMIRGSTPTLDMIHTLRDTPDPPALRVTTAFLNSTTTTWLVRGGDITLISTMTLTTSPLQTCPSSPPTHTNMITTTSQCHLHSNLVLKDL